MGARALLVCCICSKIAVRNGPASVTNRPASFGLGEFSEALMKCQKALLKPQDRDWVINVTRQAVVRLVASIEIRPLGFT